MPATKVLLVDDEPDVVEVVEFCLEQAGYEVVTASNGLEGLGAARAQDPDVILLDVMMPGENGYRVAQMIREDEAMRLSDRQVPIILLTARDLSGDPEREKMFMDFSQANLMMYKPFDMSELISQIDGLLH